MPTQTVEYPPRTSTSGWLVFAAVVTLVASFANLMYGLTLLLNDDWIVITQGALLRFDFTTVGVMYLLFAALQFFVAMGIVHGDLWARVLGMIGAGLNLLAHMAFMSAYPAWSWLVIIVDALVIYALAVHGDEVAEF